MMKKDVSPEKPIQGLYKSKDADSGFWLLLAKMELRQINKESLNKQEKFKHV